MKPSRRTFLHLTVSAAAMPAASRSAWTQSYPKCSVRIVVGFAAGITPDTVARLLAPSLSERFAGQFIVENRPGAGGNIGTEFVVRAPADGCTLLLVTQPNAINATLYASMNFNFIRDIVPVAGIVRLPFVMAVTPSFPARSIPEFIAYAKANPRKINMASFGIGTSSHVFGELFKMMAEVDLVHVPYRGSFMPDLLSGQVQVVFTAIPTAIAHIRTGKLRALGVTTATRADTLPSVPAIGEFVPGYEASGWNGLGAPKKTPANVVEMLNRAVNAGLADPTVKQQIANLGGDPMPLSSAEFAKLIADETEKWGKVIRASNIKPE